MKDYAETEVSKKAREYIKKGVDNGHLRKDLLELNFNESKRAQLSDENGNLDINKTYKSLGVDYQKNNLILRAIQLNLTTEETRKIIEERYIQLYSDWENKENANMIIRSQYPEWCEIFGIEPTKDFHI
ncbi:MAG: hypothetical protein JSV92_04045 [archaeon]|nr:MAG: hypothetical protein JSV92_04045 [archaeon]